MNMKVFQINTVCGVGSTGRIATDLYHVLKSEGHSCCIAYGRGTAPKEVDSFKINSTADVYIHTFLSRLTDREGLFSKGATKRLLKKIQDYAPDIIHLHNIHGHYLNYPMLFRFLKNYGRPVVWTLHDCWAFTGHCAYFDYVGCQRWQSGCHNCPQLKSYPQSYGIDHSRENFSMKKELFTGLEQLHIVTPSQWLADLVKKSFLKEYPVTVIHNGIDTTVFKPTESNFRKRYGLEHKKIILGVADMWLNAGSAASLGELKSQFPKFTNTRCVRNGAVYNCNKRLNVAGGNDYWESGVVQPDVVLHDLIAIMHPEVLDENDRELHYYQRLE